MIAIKFNILSVNLFTFLVKKLGKTIPHQTGQLFFGGDFH